MFLNKIITVSRYRLWFLLLALPFLLIHGSVLNDFSQYEDLELFAFVNKYEHFYDFFFKFSPEYPSVYRPLTFAYYFGLLRVFGIEPIYARFCQAVLHALCLITFYYYCRRLFLNKDSAYPYAACFFFLNQYVAYEAFLITPCTGEILMLPFGFLFLSNHIDFLHTRKKISAAKGLAWLTLCLFAKESGITFIFISFLHVALMHLSDKSAKLNWKYFSLISIFTLCYVVMYRHMRLEGTLFHQVSSNVLHATFSNAFYMVRSFFGYPNEPYFLLKEKGYLLLFYWIHILKIIAPVLFVTTLVYHFRKRLIEDCKIILLFSGASLLIVVFAHLIGTANQGIMPPRHFFLPSAFLGMAASCLSAPVVKMHGRHKTLNFLFLLVVASLNLTMLMIKEKEYQVVEEARRDILRASYKILRDKKNVNKVFVLNPPPIFHDIDRSLENYLDLHNMPVAVQKVDEAPGQCKHCFTPGNVIIVFTGVHFSILSSESLREGIIKK